jgi:hypothetical protein
MGENKLGTSRWVSGTSQASAERALRDLEILQRGQLNQSDHEDRYAPAQDTRSACDVLRAHRDDLDFREWNETTGFSGVNRWPLGPGLRTEAAARRARRRQELDEGF